MENLTEDTQIRTVVGHMRDLQTYIEEIRNGGLPPDRARHVLRAKALQLQLIEMTIRAMRIDPKVKDVVRQQLGLEQAPAAVLPGPTAKVEAAKRHDETV